MKKLANELNGDEPYLVITGYYPPSMVYKVEINGALLVLDYDDEEVWRHISEVEQILEGQEYEK